MTLHRRQLLHAAGAAGLGAALPARAQPYPARPVRLVVAASAGTTVDVNARFLSERLSARLQQGVLVDNRAGAGGGIGSDSVAKAPADGYTLLFGGVPHFTTRLMPDSALGYDPVKDFSAIAKVSSAALALVVAADAPYKTMRELVRAMQAQPGEITGSSGGNGSSSHLCMVLMNDLTQTRTRHIPYKGNTPAITDVVGGQCTFTWQGPSGVMQLVQAGKLRALAVSSRVRWESLPEVPTAHEMGATGMDMASWMAFLGPARLPGAVAQQLSAEIVRIASTPEYKEFCDKQGMLVDVMGHEAWQAELPNEQQKWKRIIALAQAQ
ncbi:tripartite tricarboxylate transporter substrate binding protein [Pseudorhodoferax sp.]|uniref:tripartite tricarboxylate transporter substrate binding protein n=1 Tax=Pseudorhodoferax sp. TaxID=1993553 RepID=UPI002DD656F9|nr:tripartite tricarboxylate transporter substrate binding protein [Pseudorhodoferax sp.]